MKKGKEKQIIKLLSHPGAAYRCAGIAKCIKYGESTPQIEELLKSLKNDNVFVLGRPVYRYAFAALDIIGAETYKGNDEDIKNLIVGLPIAFRSH